MAQKQFVDNYPGERTVTETSRLHAQHDLVTHALRGILLCPFDATQKDCRILDIGAADGWWLHCVREELAHPESATLLGTDIAPYPGTVEEVVIHDFREDFPDHWRGTFDLVQLRAVMASAGGSAVDVVRRSIQLLKPGGFIQLVDGTVASGEILGNETPSLQFFKRLGNMLAEQGMDPGKGSSVAQILQEASKGSDSTIRDQGSKSATARLGNGSHLEETSWHWLRGIAAVVGNALVGRKLISEDDFEKLKLAVFDEAQDEGIDIMWFASWAAKAP